MTRAGYAVTDNGRAEGDYSSYADAYRAVVRLTRASGRAITGRESAVDGGPGRQFVTDDGRSGELTIEWGA